MSSVSVVRSRCVSSLTTCSLSSFFTGSPPRIDRARTVAGSRRGDAKSSAEHRLGWASASRLPAVLGDWACTRLLLLRGNGLLGLLQLFQHPPRLLPADPP